MMRKKIWNNRWGQLASLVSDTVIGLGLLVTTLVLAMTFVG